MSRDVKFSILRLNRSARSSELRQRGACCFASPRSSLVLHGLFVIIGMVHLLGLRALPNLRDTRGGN